MIAMRDGQEGQAGTAPIDGDKDGECGHGGFAGRGGTVAWCLRHTVSCFLGGD